MATPYRIEDIEGVHMVAVSKRNGSFKHYEYTATLSDGSRKKIRQSGRAYRFAHLYEYDACSGPSEKISRQFTFSSTGTPSMDGCIHTFSITV